MKKTFNEINITPLTDIFLVLLIIMMVVAPMLDQQGIGLTVPENVEQTKMDKESKILTVTVTSNNKYYIHNVEVPANAYERGRERGLLAKNTYWRRYA